MFTLYNNILKKSKDKKLTIKEKTNFVKLVKQLDSEGKELLYMLIKQHSVICKDPTLFGCTIIETSNINETLTFELSNLPDILSQILYNFLILHEKRSLTESNRNIIKNEIMSSI
jgi:hypothetical protein